MANLVKILDDISALYAPIVSKWLDDNPGFDGVDTCIRPDDPRAWPTDDLPVEYANGYSDEKFEQKAVDQLNSLVDRTNEIINSCAVLSAENEPLSIVAQRVLRGKSKVFKDIEIKVTLSPGGYVHLFQHISCSSNDSMYTVVSTDLAIVLLPDLEEKHKNNLEKLIQLGLPQTAEYLQANKLILNAPDLDLKNWVEQIPNACKLELVTEGEITRLYACANKLPKMMASEEYISERTELFDLLKQNGFEIIKTEKHDFSDQITSNQLKI